MTNDNNRQNLVLIERINDNRSGTVEGMRTARISERIIKIIIMRKCHTEVGLLDNSLQLEKIVNQTGGKMGHQALNNYPDPKLNLNSLLVGNNHRDDPKVVMSAALLDVILHFMHSKVVSLDQILPYLLLHHIHTLILVGNL